MIEKQLKVWFLKALKRWHLEENKRQMPWKGEKNPYKIWLSEVILQQTRVEQGWAYYERFIKKYPTVHDLAQAADNEVFKLWEGLGYYNRCRNLLTTARVVSEQHSGRFPASWDGLLALKGIGNYTAAAIGSFAFGLPLAVVDGNVYRILSRVFGLDDPIDQSKGKRLFEQLAVELLDKKEPATYNQAIMDFGATVCKPKYPLCASCPFAKKCVALEKNAQDQYPVKSKKNKPRSRFLYYLQLECGNKKLVRKRGAGDIWKDLHEFYLVEVDEPADEISLINHSFWAERPLFKRGQVKQLSSEFIHQLTHQKIHSRILQVSIDKEIAVEGYTWMSNKEFKKIAFPRLITRYLESL